MRTTGPAVAKYALAVGDFGAQGNLIVDDTAAFNAAITYSAANNTVIVVPPVSGGYRIAGTLLDAGGSRLIAFGNALLSFTSTQMAIFSGTGSTWRDITMGGTHIGSSYQVTFTTTAEGNRWEGMEMRNINSGILLQGPRNHIDVTMKQVRGTGIKISGTAAVGNTGNFEGQNVSQFGVFSELGAHNNHFGKIRKRLKVSEATAYQQADSDFPQFMGVEAYGVRFDCYDNTVDKVFSEQSGDAGMTLTGTNNTIGYAEAIDCKLAGISLPGNANTIRSGRVRGCVDGVKLSPAAGSFSKRNRVFGVEVTGCYRYGIGHNHELYRDWVSGATYATSVGYCAYGLNVYQTVPNTSTFGTTPPTHTSGTVSDGVNNWTFLSSDPVTLDADQNAIYGCRSTGNGLAINATGDVTSGSPSITGIVLTDKRSISAGMSITGTGIPASTFIATVTGTTITLKDGAGNPVNATATGSAVALACRYTSAGDIVALGNGKLRDYPVDGPPRVWPRGSDPRLLGLTKPTVAVREILDRRLFISSGGNPPSGQLGLFAVEYQQGDVLTGLAFTSGGTAAVTPTNQWFALYGTDGRTLLKQTVDNLTTAWGTSTTRSLPWIGGGTYVIPADGLYYHGICIVAATVPTLRSIATTTDALVEAPILHGVADTGLTGTAPNPAAVMTVAGSIARTYGY